jgi:hypothetical protein
MGKEYQYHKDDRAAAVRRRRDLVRKTEMMRNAHEEEGTKKVQTKLEINQPGDKHEQEADAVAKAVVSDSKSDTDIQQSKEKGRIAAMRSAGYSEEKIMAYMEEQKSESDTTPAIQKKSDEEESGLLMAKGESGGLNGTSELQAKLDSSKGGGQSLDDKTKGEMESKMGADLSDVKIHTGTNAHEMAEGINAKAFTHGQDIYFKDGNYDTGSKEGKELLAHELTHTQQQKDGVDRKVQREEEPGRKEKKAQKILSEFITKYNKEYNDPENPIALKIKRKDAKKYWTYFTNYLLSRQIGKDTGNGKLEAYTYAEILNIDKGDEDYLVIPATGGRPDVKTSKKENETGAEHTGVQVKAGKNEDKKDAGADQTKVSESSGKIVVFTYSSPQTRYSGTKRPGISPFKELTEEVKQKYGINWTEVYNQFAAENKGETPYTISQYTRRALADGWTPGDKVPNMHEVYDAEAEGNVRIIEAYSEHDAFGYAFTKYKTDKSYWKFRWQTPIAHSKSGIQNPVLAEHAEGTNLENLSGKPPISFETLASIAGDEGKVYSERLSKQKIYNEKIRSKDFVELVKIVQMKISAETGQKVESNGIYDPSLISSFEAFKLKEQFEQATHKAQVENINIGIYDEKTQLTHYELENRTLDVKKDELMKLKDVLDNGSDAEIISLLNKWDASDQKFRDMLYLLDPMERFHALLAYAGSHFLWEDEEKIVNQILLNVRSSQKEGLKADLYMRDRYIYGKLRDLVNNTETKRDFYTAVTLLNITIDDKKLMEDAKTEATSGNALVLDDRLEEMSPLQIQKILWPDRKAMLDKFKSLEGSVRYSDTLDDLIINTPSDQVKDLKAYLKTNNFNTLVVIEQQLMGSDWDNLQPYLDTLFGKDADAQSVLINKIYSPSSGKPSLKHLAYNLPKTVIAGLNDIQKIRLISEILQGSYTDTWDEATILKVIDTVGYTVAANQKPENPDASIDPKAYVLKPTQYSKAQQNSFYDYLEKDEYKIKGKTLLEALRDSFQGDNNSKLEQKLGDLNTSEKGIKTQKSDVEKSDRGDRQYTLPRMGNEAMGTLNLATREEYILNILGWEKLGTAPDPEKVRTGFLSYFKTTGTETGESWWHLFSSVIVGDSDEFTLIRLIDTTPAKNARELMEWMGQNKGRVYRMLERYIDGAEFSDLHNKLYKKSLQINELDPATKGTLGQQEKEMKAKGLKHPKVVPWADPGLLKMFAQNEYRYKYDLSFTDKGRIKVEYDMQVPFFIPGSVIVGWNSFPQTTKEYDPWEMIGVDFVIGDEDLMASKGEVRMMPAINLFELQNKQFKQRTFELIDIAALALGVGELSAAVKLSQVLLASVDVALTAGSLIMTSYRKNIPDEVYYTWQAATIALGGYFGVKLLSKFAAATGKAIKNIGKTASLTMLETADQADAAINSLRKALDKVTDASTREALEAEIARMEKQSQLLRRIASMKLDEADELADAVTKSDVLDPQSKYNLLATLEQRKEVLSGKTAGKQTTIDYQPPVNKTGSNVSINNSQPRKGVWSMQRYVQVDNQGNRIKDVKLHFTYNNDIELHFDFNESSKQWEFKPVEGQNTDDFMGKRLAEELNKEPATAGKSRVDEVVDSMKAGEMDKLSGAELTIKDVIGTNFDQLTTFEKNLSIFAETEPRIAEEISKIKAGTSALSQKMQKALTDAMDNKNLFGKANEFRVARRNTVEKINNIIRENIDSFADYRLLIGLTKQRGSIGGLGEVLGSKVAKFLGFNVIEKVNLELGKAVPVFADRTRIIVDKMFQQPSQFTLGEIKVGTSFDPEQLENYYKIFDNQDKLLTRLSKAGIEKPIDGVTYILVPNADDFIQVGAKSGSTGFIDPVANRVKKLWLKMSEREDISEIYYVDTNGKLWLQNNTGLVDLGPLP